MERMSTLDAGFFFVEHENVPMHIGSLARFEGPAPSYRELTQLFEAKLPLVPRYRQVVRTAPFQVVRPVWADDGHFEITNHVRQVTVPAPGGKRQLRDLAAMIFAQRLDRAQPLWEAWLVDGLKRGRWAILSKVHHCMVDGVGGNDLMTAIFELTPDAELPAPSEWSPQPAPTTVELLAGGLREMVGWPLRQLGGLPGMLIQPLLPPADVVPYSRGLTAGAQRLAAPSASALNGPIGPYRRWAWAAASLAEIREIRGAVGGTVNDVLLAAVTRGFRDLLAARGELSDRLVVRSLVPVSVRHPDQAGEITNRISALLANLPVGEPDPRRRLAVIRDQMDEMKRTSQAAGAEALTGLLGFAAPTLLALGSRAAFQLPQPLVQTVTTNVPGPQFPLYVLGRKLTKVYPYVPIGDNVRISVAIFSYEGRFAFGITADYFAVPDIAVLAQGIRRGLDELRGQVAEPRRAAAG
jgi:diacylglycerol O-acyltransferase / wax synthase